MQRIFTGYFRIVVIWRHLLCFSSRSDPILIDNYILESTFVNRSGFDNRQLNLILPLRSLSLLATTNKEADSLQLIIDSCIMRCPGDTSKFVLATIRTPFVLVHPKQSKGKHSDIPSSLEEFLSLGDHGKPWRLLMSGDESLLCKFILISCTK